MSRYPDWVNKHKVKGTAVKKVGNSYYLYQVTSKRVPGKKYPQPIQKFIGTITHEGVIKSSVRKISTEKVKVYEYGLSYTLKALLPEKFLRDLKSEEKGNSVFLNIVKHFSPSSYLLRDIELPTAEELHVNIAVQIKKFERLVKIEISELFPLLGLYLVETKECDMLSQSTPEMEELLGRLGVCLHEI